MNKDYLELLKRAEHNSGVRGALTPYYIFNEMSNEELIDVFDSIEIEGLSSIRLRRLVKEQILWRMNNTKNKEKEKEEIINRAYDFNQLK